MKKLYTIRRKMDVLLEETDEKEAQDSKDDPADKRDADNALTLQKSEDTYCELKAGLEQLRGNPRHESAGESSSAPVQPVSSAFSKVKLPEIRLPTFGGKTRDWVTFRDMFRSLIHRNDQLNEIDKFTNLRSSLVGEALQEIGTIEITAANYNIAWVSCRNGTRTKSSLSRLISTLCLPKNRSNGRATKLLIIFSASTIGTSKCWPRLERTLRAGAQYWSTWCALDWTQPRYVTGRHTIAPRMFQNTKS